MVQIHGMSSSFNTTKTLYVAEELGINYKFCDLNFMQGEHKAPEHLKRHPLGKAPTLTLEDGSHLFESGAICRFFATESNDKLYGQSSIEKAKTDQWLDFFSVHSGRWLGTLTFEKVLKEQFNMGTPNQESIKEATGFLDQQFTMLNEHLSHNKYLTSSNLSIADLFAFAYMETTDINGINLNDYPHIHTWYHSLKQLPSVLRVKEKFKS